MVDVAAIFSEIFGPDDQDKGVSKNRCVRCVGVFKDGKSLESQENPNTPAVDKKHTSNQGVCEADARCVQDIVENQEVAGGHTPTHRTHLKSDNPLETVNPDAFEERAAIIHEAHTITIADDGAPLPDPIFTLTQEQAETLAAREQGFDDAPNLHRELVERWAAEIERLGKLPAVSPEGAKALKRAQVFIADGWALQAVRLGWDEIDLFGVCPIKMVGRMTSPGACRDAVKDRVTQSSHRVNLAGRARHQRPTADGAHLASLHARVSAWEKYPSAYSITICPARL